MSERDVRLGELLDHESLFRSLVLALGVPLHAYDDVWGRALLQVCSGSCVAVLVPPPVWLRWLAGQAVAWWLDRRRFRSCYAAPLEEGEDEALGDCVGGWSRRQASAGSVERSVFACLELAECFARARRIGPASVDALRLVRRGWSCDSLTNRQRWGLRKLR